MEAGSPGGILIVSLYMHSTIGPWHSANANLLEQMRLLTRAVNRPFVIAADWNTELEQLSASGFPEAVRGAILHDGHMTRLPLKKGV